MSDDLPDAALRRRAGVLTVIAPPEEAGRSISVDPRGSVVGRDVRCQLPIACERISRHHAVVRARGGGYEVEDLGSTNGTLLNGEPVTGVRRLRDGDRICVADIEIEFQLLAQPAQGRRGGPHPVTGTIAADEPHRGPDIVIDRPEQSRRSLRQEVQQAPGSAVKALLLAVAGSVVGTVFTSLAGSGQWGTLVGAAVLPVVTATFSTKQAGETGRVRMAAVVLLTVAALVITVTGFTLADGVAGKSVITGEQKGTFPRLPVPSTPPSPTPPRTASPTASPMASLQVKPTSVGCGTVAVGSTMPCPEKIEIEYTGAGLLHITSLELTGEQKDDFNASVSDQCWTLDPGETCPLNVTFHPETAGRRNATLVIHQTLPPPDTGTRVPLTGTGTDTDGSPSPTTTSPTTTSPPTSPSPGPS